MAFRVKGIDHVVIRTADIAALRTFYVDVLGLAIERTIEEIGLVQLRAGAAILDLLDVTRAGGQAPAKTGRNMDHLCLRIEPFDEAALRSDLERRGVPIGEAGRRYGADGFGPSLYIEDPDGNVVELKGPPAG